MKTIATRALSWSALVGLYAVSPLAGIAALAAGFGFIAGGIYSPISRESVVRESVVTGR